MGSVSAAKKFALAGKVLVEQAGRSRLGGALLSGARASAASFAKAFHVLWLEVTGFIFLSLGAIGGLAGVREYYKVSADPVNPNKVWAAGIFAILFAYFGISSFWRARKKRV